MKNVKICKPFYLLYHEFPMMQETIDPAKKIPGLFTDKLDK